MFDIAFKRVNTFEDFRTELVEGKEKRAGTELIQEITKKQKVEDDKETAKLKQFMEIILDEEEVAIDVIPLSVNTPILEDGENVTLDQIRRRNKWDNDDYVCRDLILNVSINSIIESRDTIFNEIRFSSVPRPSQRSLTNGTKDIGGSVVPEKVYKEVTKEVVTQQPEPDLRKGKWNRTPKNFIPEFQLYLIKRTRDEVSNFLVANESSKEKLKVDVTIKKFKARLVIQGFRQKSGIDYFDTYALVTRIEIIRLLIAMASIHNLIIHQMDVKTNFLNGELDGEVYMNQPHGFIMHGNENKVCKQVSTPMDTSDKLMPNNGQAVSQLEYSRVIGCLSLASNSDGTKVLEENHGL
nr:zinc finger, CCHC-type [Tanacetum cinerariifolium]